MAYEDGQAQILLQLPGDLMHFMVTAGEPIPAGKRQVRMEFKYDGGGLGKGGDVTLDDDGKPVGQGRVERTQPRDLLSR